MVLRLAMLALLLPLSNGLLISQQPRLRPSCRQAGASLRPSCRPCFMKAAGEAKAAKAAAVEPLPSTLLPITLSVFAQMLGEGIAISSLPLYMTNLGASPMQVGLATSCFSAAQMVCCPLLVSLSSRVGRALVLRVCLIGATASSLLIAGSGSISGILLGRLFAGIFAASVPVAQSAATDIVSGPQTARALSRVAAAAQAGVVVGPAASALIMEAAGLLGVPAPLRLRCAFAFSATLAAGILLASLSPRGKENAGAIAAGAADGAASGASVPPPPPPAPPPPPVGVGRMAQPGLRLMAVIVGWALTLSVGTYGLFAPRVMGYRQPQLSATYSAGAATTILVQLAIFPRLVGRLGKLVRFRVRFRVSTIFPRLVGRLGKLRDSPNPNPSTSPPLFPHPHSHSSRRASGGHGGPGRHRPRPERMLDHHLAAAGARPPLPGLG